jgi:hypothetical protein
VSMSKKDFIALADAIQDHNRCNESKDAAIRACCPSPFSNDQIKTLADFCQSQNPRFNRERWLAYIAGVGK